MGTRSSEQHRKKGLASVLLTLVAGMAMVSQTAQPTQAAGWACRGTHLRPGASIQRAINLKPTGATFCLHRGTYRISAPLRPKDGQRFIGQKGAAMSGARRVKSWSRSGRLWVATGQTQQFDHIRGNCSDLSTTICRYPEQLFLNGKNLRQVSTQTAVRRGRFFFDYDANKIFIATDPNGKKLETSVTSAAFQGGPSGIHGVALKRLRIEQFASPSGAAAIASGPGWLVTRSNIVHNAGIGICATGGSLLLRNHVHHNGQMGLCGKGSGIRVIRNEIDHNNTARYSLMWESGGAKFMNAENLVVRANRSHHNLGHGLWTDMGSRDVLYEDNTVVGNALSGIVHEVSYRATIRGNKLKRNGRRAGWIMGGGAIFISNSSNVSVVKNRMMRNENGVVLLEVERGAGHSLHDVSVRQNRTSCSGNVGGVESVAGAALFGSGNVFRSNDYRLRSQIAKAFRWAGGAVTKSEWRKFGNDREGRFRFGC